VSRKQLKEEEEAKHAAIVAAHNAKIAKATVSVEAAHSDKAMLKHLERIDGQVAGIKDAHDANHALIKIQAATRGRNIRTAASRKQLNLEEEAKHAAIVAEHQKRVSSVSTSKVESTHSDKAMLKHLERIDGQVAGIKDAHDANNALVKIQAATRGRHIRTAASRKQHNIEEEAKHAAIVAEHQKRISSASQLPSKVEWMHNDEDVLKQLKSIEARPSNTTTEAAAIKIQAATRGRKIRSSASRHETQKLETAKHTKIVAEHQVRWGGGWGS